MFCAWAERESAVVFYRDEDTFALVDMRQPREGHVLVIPLVLGTVLELDDKIASAVMRTTVRVARAVEAEFEPDGISLWQSNGPGAFQEVPHFHMHVIPRWESDGLLRIYPEVVRRATKEERGAQGTRIAARMS